MADVIDKVLQNLFSARCVRDLRMKLEPVEFALRIFDRRKVGAFRARGRAKTFRQRGHFIAMAIPDVELRTQAIEKFGAIGNVQHARAVLAPPAENDLAAEMMRHLHEAVTNPEDRNA